MSIVNPLENDDSGDDVDDTTDKQYSNSDPVLWIVFERMVSHKVSNKENTTAGIASHN